jgi:hypothetical protein
VGGQGPYYGPGQAAVHLAVCCGSEYKKYNKNSRLWNLLSGTRSYHFLSQGFPDNTQLSVFINKNTIIEQHENLPNIMALSGIPLLRFRF